MYRLQGMRPTVGYIPQRRNESNNELVDNFTNLDLSAASAVIDMEGDGFLDNRPKVLNDLIKKYGQYSVKLIEVCRSPIYSVFEKILNFFSAGRLMREKERLGYDQLFHLYIVLHLSNKAVISIEKNQRIKVIYNRKFKEKTECLKEYTGGKYTLEEFVTAPEKQDMTGLYRYSGLKYNCQDYVYRLCNSSGIAKFNDFIKQDVETLVPNVIKKISNTVTDIAAVGDWIIRGGEYK